MSKIPVGVLGATGMVGQRFLQLLAEHPWFEVVHIAASDRSAGRSLAEAGRWLMDTPLPEQYARMQLQAVDAVTELPLVFSAVPSEVAREIEPAWAQAGALVCSNAGAYRRDPLVPLLVPEVNPDHLALIKTQRRERGWSGAILTNPNCTTTHAILPLRALHDAYGINMVQIFSMQAISGAGYPGVASYDVIDNVVPFIAGEEEKVEWEPRKLLGLLREGIFMEAEIEISAHCNRVAVIDGHTECLSIKFDHVPENSAELAATLNAFRALPQSLELPSAPAQPIVVTTAEDGPQPRRDRMTERGMATVVGRIRPCAVLDYKFVLMGHNTLRGAAGGSILNAELLAAHGMISGYAAKRPELTAVL